MLHQYFSDCADAWDVRKLVEFDTEATALTWDETNAGWTLELRTTEGESTRLASIVISAVGQLNRPILPSIEGRESYAGTWWHSARWPADADLAGKRVGIIGTGSSAAQFIPAVAAEAASLTVFQRTANWLVPRPQADQAVADSMKWLFSHVPHFGNWHRLGMFWRGHEGLRPTVEVDPDWHEDIEHSVSALETTPISHITPTGVVTTDGTEHEFDVLIYGTGFAASEFLMPMKITGRDGVELHDQWNGDARVFLGIKSPNMPNLFLLYGPNTNIVINGSIIFFSECETHYITQCVHALLERGGGSMAVIDAVHDEYNTRVDAGNLRMAWGVSDVSSWCKNTTGRTAQNWPFTVLEYWQQTRQVDDADYVWR